MPKPIILENVDDPFPWFAADFGDTFVMERVEIKAGTDKKCNSLDFTQRASLFRRRRQTQLDGREREKKSIYIRAY